jgi:uracil-DNA glycosylase family 4
LFVNVRPADRIVEFLQARRDSGTTHVYLDDQVRARLRALHQGLKSDRIAAADPDKPRSKASLSHPSENESAGQRPLPQPIAAAVATSGDTKTERLEQLRRQAESWEPARSLGTLRDKMVFATGDPNARLMLVGEAPGYEEERKGEPFVGPAGKKLDEILRAMGVAREGIYISNIVKFRPATARQTTNNRKPDANEIASCLPLLREEISIVRPECIVAMGGTAAEGLLGLKGTVGSMRGHWHEFQGTLVRVTYHPSYLLQSGGSLSVKRQLWEDMLAVMEQLGLPVSEKQRGFFLPKDGFE